MTSNNSWMIGAGVAALAGVGFGFLKWKEGKCCNSKKDASCCERISQSEVKVATDEKSLQKQLHEFFPRLVADFTDYVKTSYQMPDSALKRLETMFDYNCSGGKLYRGMLVMTTVRDLCLKKNLGRFEDKLEKAMVVAWCIEILQACFLVADDIMDDSQTRRGKPCWYRVDGVGLDAVNDTLILESLLYFALRKYFSASSPVYVTLTELFQEVSLQTQLGQMLDLTSNPQGKRAPGLLRSFNLDLYKKIVHYKTAFYTFYLSVASGMILCGITSPAALKVARQVSIALGEKFQIEDDYLDCFGDPAVIGKIGTDIQDHKCSWLVVQALLRCTPQQLQQLESWYGQKDEESVANVKKLYHELNLPEVFDKQEEQSYTDISAVLKANDHLVPSFVFSGILDKIHRRQK